MYYVLYEFSLKNNNHKDKFFSQWIKATKLIKLQYSGALGSRLHQCQSNSLKLVAYAKWKTKNEWINFSNLKEHDKNLEHVIQEMRKCLSSNTKIVFNLCEIDDFIS